MPPMSRHETRYLWHEWRLQDPRDSLRPVSPLWLSLRRELVGSLRGVQDEAVTLLPEH